jgi:hypothetical protein
VAFRVPLNPDEFDTLLLEKLVRTAHPDVRLASASVVDAALSSEGDARVSTARRIAFDVTYAEGSDPVLPARLMVKVARPEYRDIPLYENEVNVFTRIGKELPIRVPRSFGGVCDPESVTFGLVLEDLRSADATFESVLSALTPDDTATLLDQLAVLHAAYWESPRFDGDLDWVFPHTSGPIHELFSSDSGVVLLIEHELATHQFKREVVQSISETVTSLRDKVARVQAHQATLPRTLLHGDAHVGNTYRLADGQRGYLDLQLASRGFCMHDVSYTIVTSLNVEDRRAHERELIARYRQRLVDLGVVAPPSTDQLFHQHRLAMAWCLYIGWLTSPTENYGWEITVANHVRIGTAYRDLDSSSAIEALAATGTYVPSSRTSPSTSTP